MIGIPTGDPWVPEMRDAGQRWWLGEVRVGSSANRVTHVILGCRNLVFKPGKFQANEYEMATVAETCLHRDRKQINDCQGLEGKEVGKIGGLMAGGGGRLSLRSDENILELW